MPTTLTTKAIERSTFVITAVFTDEDDAAVTPNVPLTWSLYDFFGVAINSRESVSITPASTINIVLSGLDLALTGDDQRRVVLIEGDYDSSYGNGFPIKDEVLFEISNLKNVI